MFCVNCGKELNDGDVFCRHCGKPVRQNTQAAEPVAKEPEISSWNHNDSIKVEMDTVKYDTSQNASDFRYEDLPTKEKTGIENIYFVDFIIRMTKKANIPLFIYLLINVVIIGLIATMFCALPVGWGILVGLLVYIASIAIALSPIGEAMLRKQTNCKMIEDADIIERLEPLFREVYYKAKKEDPSISEDVRLFMSEDECPNAFATGRKTVCVTKGLLALSDEQIKATLAHEFGHLAHKDTDRILVVSVGNTVINIIMWMFQLGAIMMEVIMNIVGAITGDDDGFLISLMGTLSRVITMFIITKFMQLWTWIGTMLCMKTSRNNEFQADAFAVDLGFGDGIVKLLEFFDRIEEKPSGLFANLASSHPNSDTRIAHVKEYQAQKLGMRE